MNNINIADVQTFVKDETTQAVAYGFNPASGGRFACIIAWPEGYPIFNNYKLAADIRAGRSLANVRR
jgi:hypothetical protein